MASRHKLIACLFLLEVFRCCHSDRITPPSNTDPAFVKGIVDAHNKYRAVVIPQSSNMLYMSWDTDLATIAQLWANSCKFARNPELKKPGKIHPVFRHIGENFWIGSYNAPATAIDQWASELAFYEYALKSCTKTCDHYTQVVWADSFKVGCGAAFCPNVENSRQKDVDIVVCNYGPAGNFRGDYPYKEGQACTNCSPKDTCENKLCRDSTRDAVKEPSLNPVTTPKGTKARTTFVQMQIYSPMLSLTYISLYVVS